MNTKGKIQPPKGIDDILHDFLEDVPEAEFDAALLSAGESPADLLAVGKHAIARALTDFSKEVAPSQTNDATLRKGLSTLVSMLRRRDGLSEEALATNARVDVEEIKCIETDVSYMPRPRTIYQLEEYFQLPARSLARLSGLTATHPPGFQEEVLRFAASSKSLHKLTRDEKRLLNEFVRFLTSTDKGE